MLFFPHISLLLYGMNDLIIIIIIIIHTDFPDLAQNGGFDK
jgi:hypothetical protein